MSLEKSLTNYLDEIEARVKAATPGPWSGGELGSWGSKGFFVSPGTDHKESFSCENDTKSARSNAVLMMNAPADLAILIAIVRRYEEALSAIHNMSWQYEKCIEKARADVAEIIGKRRME